MHVTMRRHVVPCLAAWVAAGLWGASPAGAVAEAEPAADEPAAEETVGSEEAGGAAAAAEAAPEDSVPRGVFTTQVADREPTDRVETLGNDSTRIYYFTELRGLDGRVVTHRWEHGGEVRAEVEFVVGGDRWRVHSSKNLDPSWLGEWTVQVVDEAGNVLRQDRFVYTAEESAEDTAAGDPGEEAEAVPEEAPASADLP